MTKRDFRAIARAIRRSYITSLARREVVAQLAVELKIANPAFDRARFMDACDPNTPTPKGDA